VASRRRPSPARLTWRCSRPLPATRSIASAVQYACGQRRLNAGPLDGSYGGDVRSSVLGFAIAITLTACMEKSIPAGPPAQRDAKSELRKHDPTMPLLKENPKPEAWMIGCWRISPEALPRAIPYPQVFRLTAEPIDTHPPQQHYAVRPLTSLPERIRRNRWYPRVEGGIEISFSDGYSAVAFIVRGGVEGLTGEGIVYGEMDLNIEKPRFPVTVTSVACTETEPSGEEPLG
jgi:hypothetical protein